VDGLIWAASMVVLDASRRDHRVPRLAALSLGAGIVATVGANLAHGLSHGPIGAQVSAWSALALVGSFELLMLPIRTQRQGNADRPADAEPNHLVPALGHDEPPVVPPTPSLEQTVRAWHSAGHSQRAIARDLNIGRRKVKQITELDA
jgi:hypothetical protein